MIRHRLLLLFLATLFALASCSDNPDNQPPTVQIVYPESGHRVTVAPDSMIAEAQDDHGVANVEFYFDGELLSTKTSTPYETRLPVGTYADGRDHELWARAIDGSGLRSGLARVTVSIDPALQTIPQISSFAVDEDGSGDLHLSWLEFPETVDEYEWELSRDDGFFDVVASGSVVDTTLVLGVVAEGLAYARVRAVTPAETTGWSRSARFDSLDTWRQHYDLPDQQLGTGIYQATDGTLRILSTSVDRHRVSQAPVQLLALDEANDLAAVHDLFPDSYRATAQALDADGNLRLAGVQDGGEGFVAATTLDGDILWSGSVDFMRCSTLLANDDGSWQTVGVDLRDGAAGGVFATIGDDGSVTAGATFDLEAGREVVRAWPRPAGGWVLAGQLPDTDAGRPGGVWVRGLAADHAAEWDLRLGTGANYLLRGGGADGAGNYVVGGIALVENYLGRYGFIASFDADGRIRWQVTDRDWNYFADAASDAGGRWTVVGVYARDAGDSGRIFVFGMRGFSAAGLSLWQVDYEEGVESQGWTLAPHPDGGWWAAGTVTYDYAHSDLDLFRLDDHGEFD